MKHKTLITMFAVVALLLSGPSHALLIMMPDGTKTEAQVVGNKLMLRDATGKLTPARDGAYKTGDGKALIVKGGIIATQGNGGTVAPSVGAAPGISPLKAPAAGLPPVLNPSPTAGGKPAETSSPSRLPAPMAPPAAGGAAVNAIKIEQLSSKAQFKALSDDTLLDIGGRKIRKGDFVAEFKRRAADWSAGATIRSAAGLAAIQARLTAEENAAIAASEAEVRRRMAEIRAKEGGR